MLIDLAAVINWTTRILKVAIALVSNVRPGADTPGEKTRKKGRSPRRTHRAHRHHDAINYGINAPVTVNALIRQIEPPFIERVMRVRVSSRFKLPSQLEVYKGKTNLIDHLDSYKNLMILQVHQNDGEILKNYIKRFNQVCLEVKDPSDKVVVVAMMEGLRLGPLFDSLSKSVLETLSALQSKADKYIADKELVETKHRRQGKDDNTRKEPDTWRTDYRGEMKSKRSERDARARINEPRPRTPPRQTNLVLPSLNAPIAQVLMEIKNEDFVKWLGKIKTNPFKRNKNKYYEFHKDHSHNIESCFQLKEQIVDLINREYLRKFIADCPRPDSLDRRYVDNRPTTGNAEMEALRNEVGDTPLVDPRDTKNTKPLEEVARISLHPDYPDRHVMIRTELTTELRNTMVIEKEVVKLIKANVKESHYPNWLANVVISLKKWEKWRVCIDFTNLNKACPKDSFPLPKIDLIVDATYKSEMAFQQLKEYLGSPPLLMVPSTSEELILYMFVSPTAVSAVLIREKHKVQKPVYYVSKVLIGAETRYLKIDKFTYALMIASRKLCHYFQAHLIIWSIELSEFHISYQPRMAIMAQALDDFIVEFKYDDLTRRADGVCYTYWFKATNNEADYEAFITGLRFAT
ncbi:hypothetical protein Acr_00g0086310 [Actinidia rufa]|uniref:Reverse transcriptase/retrotransposon-derived protein RNase H-like domain-containing protein n=1 Tax=Actinidia rufa TaxID=165716 RepID=A0A7J0DWX7_9ERIC|nr:hypothetical protein Acr_00g0086310 [Actinidia rufa]